MLQVQSFLFLFVLRQDVLAIEILVIAPPIEEVSKLGSDR